MRAVLLLMVAGCGRVGFTDRPETDATIVLGHDEDGDGLADASDPCPHVGGDTADRDSDGVGDACDPRPDTPGDAFAVFSPFTPEAESPFETPGPLVQNADSVEVPDQFGFHIAYPVQNTHIEVGFDILERIGTEQHQLALGAVAEPYYFGELNDNLEFDVSNVNIAYANRMTNSYESINTQDLATVVHTGEGMIRLSLHTDPSPTYAMDAGWPGESYRAAGPTPGYVGADLVNFVVNHLRVQLRYLVVIQEG